ncbi:MAG: hypothetical protein LBH96_06125 [Candidatus Peribacteria bacterium]|jgi:hypothetical protein|nr:hypothetical protein [Candidatus Peribacteria bacterium]
MKSILSKLYTGTASQLVDDIIDTYEEQHFCVINFLYFANIVSQNVFNVDEKKKPKKKAERKYM